MQHHRFLPQPLVPFPPGSALVLAVAATLACAAGAPPSSDDALADYVLRDAKFSPLHYPDRGQVTANDRCPVRHTKLNPAIEPVMVNGRPIGFC